MSAPNLSISVQPTVGSKATCLPVAASAADQPAHVKIVLRLDITNHGPDPVTIHRIRYSFPGTANAPFEMKAEDVYYDGILKDIPAGKTVIFSNGVVPLSLGSSVENPQFLPAPIPPKVTISLFCTDNPQPKEVTLDLVAHQSPVAGNAFLFPYAATDLRQGEYFVTQGHHWANGGNQGSQIFAHDIRVHGVAPGSGTWSELLPGKNGTKNEHYRIYGKPVRAMADGVVLNAVDGVVENVIAEHRAMPMLAPTQGRGNYVLVRHGTEVVLYAHLQPGLPTDIGNGALVKAGQVLGRVGNTGSSSNPHTHIEVYDESTKTLRGFPFRDAWVLAMNRFSPPNPQGPWVELTGQGIGKDQVAIWPAKTKPAWYPPGWAEVARHGIPEAQWQAEFKKIASSGYRLVWFNGYMVNGSTFFNCIWRPNGNVTWQARHNLSGSEFQSVFDQLTSNEQGYRLVHIESYSSGGTVKYAAIFIKGPGPGYYCYHGKTKAEHVALDQAWRSKGFVPVNVCVVNVGGELRFSGIYEALSVGSVQLDHHMTREKCQLECDKNLAAGRHLVYLNSYEVGGEVRFVAIWHQKAANEQGRLHLSGAQYQAYNEKFVAMGLLTRAVTGYEIDDKHHFAAFWTK